MPIPTRCLVAAMALLLPTATRAQDSPARKAPAPAAIAVAEQLLVLMNTEEVMAAGFTVAFEAQLKLQPELAPLMDVVKEWASRIMTMKEMGPPLATAYAEHLSEEDLRAIVTFYQTPAGRRLAAALPDLTRRGSEIGSAVAEAHMAELEQLIATHAAQLQNPPAPAPTPP